MLPGHTADHATSPSIVSPCGLSYNRSRSRVQSTNYQNVMQEFIVQGTEVENSCTYVTRSVKRDLNSLFKMHVLQRSVFPQCYEQSKSNRCFTEEALLQQWRGNEVLVQHHQGVMGRSSQRLRSRWVFRKLALLRRCVPLEWREL